MPLLLSLVLVLLTLVSPAGRPETASVTTKSGTVQGEIQGVIVARRPFKDDQFDLAVMDGPAILAIDERGIRATKMAWQSVVPIPGIKLPPVSRIAETLVGQQLANDSAQPHRFSVIGELARGSAGSSIVPAIRVKADGTERVIPVDDIVQWVPSSR